MKWTISLATALACACVTFGADDLALGPVIAKGKGVEVRRGQLDDAFIAYSANLAARGTSLPIWQRQTAEAQLLDRMIVAQLLITNATPADLAAAKPITERFCQEAMSNAGTPGDFFRHLKSLSMTPAQFTNRAMERAISEVVIKRILGNTYTITDADVKTFYETNGQAFMHPELARASHIVISTRDLQTGLPYPPEQKAQRKEKAQKVLERARKGDDFAKLVAENSDEPSAKENKGEYKIARAKDEPRRAMVPEIEKALFALKPGEISDLITTEVGYHIIKLHEIIPARKTPLADVEGRIREHLTQAELEKRMPPYFEKLKKEAAVEILDERLKTALEKLPRDGAGRSAP
jgi:peptidyl-prolyl cis-trans isomerase C